MQQKAFWRFQGTESSTTLVILHWPFRGTLDFSHRLKYKLQNRETDTIMLYKWHIYIFHQIKLEGGRTFLEKRHSCKSFLTYRKMKMSKLPLVILLRRWQRSVIIHIVYVYKYMCVKLFRQFEDEVIIMNINGRPNIVTFRKAAGQIL